MAAAASKASTLTKLRVQNVEMGVALFNAHADGSKTKLQDFSSAGPNGGALKLQQLAAPAAVPADAVPVDEPTTVKADPLAERVDQVLGVAAAREAFDAELASRGAPLGEYRQQLVEEGTGEVVTPDMVRRGVRRPDGSFADCTAELARIERETKLEEMAIVAFVDASAVPRPRVKGAYYVGANDEASPYGLRLLWEAMRRTRRAAVVKLTKRSRQSLGLIVPTATALMLLELVFAEDMREAPLRAKAMWEASVAEADVENAVELVKGMSDSPAIIDTLRDDAIARREGLYQRALNGEFVGESADAEVEPSSEERALLAALEASLAAASVS